jgi:hypothetical protein
MSQVKADTYRWGDGGLHLLDYCELTDAGMAAADSWFVTNGTALAINLHRERFLDAAPGAEEFWDSAIATIPRTGDWFPRVERLDTGRLQLRLRTAPPRTRSVTLATLRGPDPRTTPLVKGPDLDAMRRLRTEAQKHGADEAVILTPDGYVVEGAYSAIAWWRGSILCYPPEEFARVNSVTARSLLALATALGVDTLAEPVTPAELDGCEVWTLNALHGARIATRWIDGPQLAEEPGRLALWNERLSRLRKPLAETAEQA